MAQFDVRPTRFANGSLVVDVQTDLVDKLETRVVIPLEEFHPHKTLSRLQPTVTCLGTRYILNTPELSSLPVTELGETVASLIHERQAILEAIAFLLTGF